MKKKLSKFGNSRALIIDKPILRLLGIDDETELEIKIKGKSLIISPVRKGKRRIVSKDKKIQEAYEESFETHYEDLKKLSEK